MPLPAFLIIGAQKAGTTSLHHVLSQHPSVWLPPIKELHYFDRESNCDEHFTKDAYASLFDDAPASATCGEATPCYLFHEHAARRIHGVLGDDAKLIVTLRNPASRAYSHYLMNVRKGYEQLSFEEAIEAEPQRLRESELSRMRFSYLARGDYHEQISRYLEYFDRSAIRVYIFEQDIIPNWSQAWSDICGFLNLDNIPAPALAQTNTARKIRSPLVRWAMQQPRLKALKNKLVSRDLNLRFRHMLTDSAEPVASSTRDSLIESRYRDGISKLETLLNRSLTSWT